MSAREITVGGVPEGATISVVIHLPQRGVVRFDGRYTATDRVEIVADGRTHTLGSQKLLAAATVIATRPDELLGATP